MNNNNEINSIKSDQIKTKLNKKMMSRKQKTNSLQIKNNNNFFSSFNNNKITKEINQLKRNNAMIINEHKKIILKR